MDLVLTQNGVPVHLVASCLEVGDTIGGLLYYDGETWIAIDDVSTTGLYVHNDELIRVLRVTAEDARSASILHYTAAGLARQVAVESLIDPHDVLWDGEHYVVVSSFHNSVVWVTAAGVISKLYQPVQGADCWHLNSLVVHDRVIHATAFGRFADPRGWVGHERKGVGMLFRLDTGEDVLAGLCCPHTPRFESGAWFVCNSANSELVIYSPEGQLIKRVQLDNWVRGLAFTDRYLLVGESVNRQFTDEALGASVAVLDRDTYAVLERLSLPFREVYDLVLTSSKLLEGIVSAASAPRLATCESRI